MRSEILKAGEVLNVDEVDREAVENWDGEEDLLQEDATRLHPTNEVPEPPEAIKKLFEEATPHMVKLRDDPSDAGARTNLEQLNLRLREATGTYIAEAGAQLSDRIWEIQIDQFAMAFQQVKDLALKLAENPADASVQANLDITKRGIDNEIALKHFPQVWAAAPHQTNEIPEPPEAIKMLFEEATPHMVKLRDDPSNASARTNLEQLNLRLQEATRTYIAETRAQLSDDSWVIKISDFANAFQQVKDLVLKLAENPADASAQADLNNAKQLVDDEIALKHFPQSWAVTEEQLGTTTTPTHGHDSQFFYPWPTLKTHMGKIIGLTKHGRGYRPIVEWMHQGKILRTLESPSEVGSDDVEAYLNTPKSKVFFGKELPEGKKPEDRPREWTRKDRDKIQHVDWATQSMVLRKNTARNDISGRCYVCFTLKEPLPDGRPNRDMVDISTLRRIFTESKADKLVADVCKRDKILPPWQAKPVSEFHDPSKREKDVKERRLLRLELSQNSAHQRGADSTVTQHNRGHSSSGSSDVLDRGRSDGGSGGGSHENGNIDQRVTLLETSITQTFNDLQMDIARMLEDTIKTALDAAVERQKSDLFKYIDEKIATAVASAFANGRS
ncbi:hypothetical protein Purlil1_14143 [Purpureocillium lilacinum]|uniref:Uncharacterized protein n=1 Tax=Purpureocillium lilacinum TaxID=33203 RepID=A0ABR0BC52_PURLI|nr:hypothetical protein Purlil1_14143 [Purpureocillium lilacinum]